MVAIYYTIYTYFALYLFFRLFKGKKDARLMAIWTLLTPVCITFATLLSMAISFLYVDQSYWKALETTFLSVSMPNVESREKLYEFLLFPFEVVWYLTKLWAMIITKHLTIPLVVFHVWMAWLVYKLIWISWVLFGPASFRKKYYRPFDLLKS